MMTPQIDPVRAVYWRNRGLTWREVGKVLAAEDGRSLPYLENGVWHAVNKLKSKTALPKESRPERSELASSIDREPPTADTTGIR